MIPIKIIREDPEKIMETLKKRGKEFPLEELREIDKKWRKRKKEADKLRHKRNNIGEKIAEKKKKGKQAEEEIEKMQEIKKELEEKEEETKKLNHKREKLWMSLPNLLDSEVPKGETEEDNKEISKWGEKLERNFKTKTHLELARELNLIDEKASEVTGEGFYYLKNDLAMLGIALQKFTIDKLTEKGYELIEPPFMLREKIYKKATNVDKFKEDMYGVKDTDKYLIGTSEHPMAAMHKDEVYQKEELPKKYVAISPCFRKEAGTHGKYRKGLYRMHQFNKIEQFIVCKPENEEKYFKELQENAEEIYQELKIPYRVVILCGGDTPKTQAKTYDVEALMADGEYREIGSNSTSKDYQARRMNIKYEKEKYGEREYVYTLNNTGVATSRTMLAIMENHQNEKGEINIPKALQPYMNGKKKIKKK